MALVLELKQNKSSKPEIQQMFCGDNYSVLVVGSDGLERALVELLVGMDSELGVRADREMGASVEGFPRQQQVPVASLRYSTPESSQRLHRSSMAEK